MTKEIKYDNINLMIDEAAATIQLNRPQKKNAMSPALHRDFVAAVGEIEKLKGIKAIVLTGAGDAFCGGMDLEKFFFETKGDPEKWYEVHRTAESWFQRLLASPAIIIASVNGWCFGAAVAIVGACNIAIAAEEATFGLSEVNFGILPAGGTLWAVAKNFNRKQGFYYSVTGETFTGKEAVGLGLVNRSVPREKLAEETDRVVKSLVSKNGHTLAAIKEAYEKVGNMDVITAQDYENAKLHELSFRSGDDWINKGISQFKKREYRPGLGSYKLEKEK
jgi:trans-feruloyl-CoA hydratase/vanillin synthase